MLMALLVFNQPALVVGKLCRNPSQVDEESKEFNKENQNTNYNTMSVDHSTSSAAIVPIQEYVDESKLKNVKKNGETHGKETDDEENQKNVEKTQETPVNEAMRETESIVIKNLYYLGYNCNHSKLDEKIQTIFKISELKKKVKMRQIAFEPTRSAKKLNSEHANGADILLVKYGISSDFPYIAIKGFGDYEISNKANEILRQSSQ
ncbi:predicted protein [Naegleria gruberi]|uniref:Predicted protein n=1 Tax=Naegleria gruberi TaxID=5762 RepID=D2VFP3_NAEGR|nr:uncharacterized protein NAEGRDRAFT_49159 [Naegleria gruberi]EFC44506.1 predicted protein [Naegleria gruberi]|eukprot:XP_002677250.1 predicted protein [Naegleria gruberi strain NEG-M]